MIVDKSVVNSVSYLQYYNTDHNPMSISPEQLEKKMFLKASKNPNGEIFLYEGYTIVFRNNVDLFFFIIGESEENEVSDYLLFSF